MVFGAYLPFILRPQHHLHPLRTLEPLGTGQFLHLLSAVGAPPKPISKEPCRYRHRFMVLYE